MAEQLICNQQVAGSNPIASSSFVWQYERVGFFIVNVIEYGGVPEWPKGTDCKSVGEAFGGSNPPPSTIKNNSQCSIALTCVFCLGRCFVTTSDLVKEMAREVDISEAVAAKALEALKEKVCFPAVDSTFGETTVKSEAAEQKEELVGLLKELIGLLKELKLSRSESFAQEELEEDEAAVKTACEKIVREMNCIHELAEGIKKDFEEHEAKVNKIK